MLEVLIAVFILALMSIIIWQITNNAYRGTTKSGRFDEVYQGARISLKKLTDDLSMAFLAAPSMVGGVAGVAESAPVEFSFIGEKEGSSDRVNFVSFSNVRLIMDEKASDQVEIGYYVDDCPDIEEEAMCLMRRSANLIDKDPKEGGTAYPVAERVKKFSLEYYDKEKDEWKETWSSKDPAYLNKLPYAVRVTLVFEDPSSRDKEIVFVDSVHLPLSSGPIDF